MLPAQTYARLLNEGDVLGLKMLRGSAKPTFFFHILTTEKPNDLADFSLGSASAQAVAGTDWDEIIDSGGRNYLEPESEKVIYHGFFGISPGQARIYIRYPTNKDINSLLGTRSVGGAVGFIDGAKSPYLYPSPQSEFFSMKGMHPSFIGYHPYLEPTSITVRMNFFITRYDVEFLGENIPIDSELFTKTLRVNPVIRMVGGHDAVPVPAWVEQLVRK